MAGPQGVTTQGNTVLVDAVFGDDGTGARQGPPFKTISAALAAAQPGDLVRVRSGTYDESLVLPPDVSVRGDSTGTVTVQRLNVAAGTDLITMGENCRIEEMALRLTTAAPGVNLRGIVFPGTTTATSKVRTLTLTLDNTAAGDAGPASSLYALHSTGTGQPGVGVDVIRACTITVNGSGAGNKRGLLVDSASQFKSRDVNYVVNRAGAAVGSYIAIETNHAQALARIRLATVQGITADISRTLGTLQLGITDLTSSNSNGRSFTAIIQVPTFVWGESGNLPQGVSRFLRPGSGGVSVNEIKLRLTQKGVAKNLVVRSSTPPGLGRTDTVIVRKNGVDTILSASLTDNATFTAITEQAVSFAAGDDVSVRVATSPQTGTSELYATFEVF